MGPHGPHMGPGGPHGPGMPPGGPPGPHPMGPQPPQAELDNINKSDDRLDDDDDSSSATPSRPQSPKPEEVEGAGGLKSFPDCSALNSRLRRLVTAYQREFKKEEARAMAKEKRRRLWSRQLLP